VLIIAKYDCCQKVTVWAFAYAVHWQTKATEARRSAGQPRKVKTAKSSSLKGWGGLLSGPLCSPLWSFDVCSSRLGIVHFHVFAIADDMHAS